MTSGSDPVIVSLCSFGNLGAPKANSEEQSVRFPPEGVAWGVLRCREVCPEETADKSQIHIQELVSPTVGQIFCGL